MNQLRSWLYNYDSNQAQNNATLNKLANDKTKDNNTNEMPTDSPLRRALLKYIPLAPGDCLECKLVGTGVMMLSGVIVAASAIKARQSNPKMKGMNGLVYTMLCCSLFLGFETAAYLRLFDKGIFDKKTNSNK
ncbi:hypothetical protein BgiMline_008199 [Biomphalaria glabrata]|uniref:Uncharacterized protein n=1 Tax=Biomphalaria glabrata TaxID=6526 RepID=A0A2C9L4P2_BIOGL|nr:hypothetical protein BgiMline_018783 [Biomphalaria glabrata]KAI8788733.1 hypothetical protein BgiBS90_011401 [Biomphalaria glabrata]